MDSKKFVRMWTEENLNNYDLESSIINYGLKADFNLSVKEAIIYAKNFHAEFYLQEDEFVDLARKGYEFYVEQDGLEQLLKKIRKEISQTDLAMRHLLALDLQKLGSKELFQEYLNYVKPYGNLMRSYIATQPHYVSKIEKELKNKLDNFDKPEEIFNSLTSADTEFVFLKKSDFFKKSFAELLGAEDVNIDRTLLNAPLYEIKKKDQAKKKALIRKNTLPDDIVKLGDILVSIGEARFEMRLTWMLVVYFFELFLIELKNRHQISKNVLRKYDEKELDELILNGKKVDNKILEDRLGGFAKILKNGKVKTLAGREAEKFIADIHKLDEEVLEIKGSIASKGIARGRVVILSYTQSFDHAEKIKNMSDGDIVVSEMTRPNIIVACEKAGAIITDEGGITCHAAIISRELNKPCVIGTKIATQVLKDGDLVEVDADNGVVRILEKKS